MPLRNDNSIKQGFVVPMPNNPTLENFYITLAEKVNSYNRDYLIIQNLSSVNPIYMSFHKPRKGAFLGNFCEEGEIEIGPKQAWQEYPEDVHQGEVYIYTKKYLLIESLDENNNQNGSSFVSINYNGAYEFFVKALKPVLPPIYD